MKQNTYSLIRGLRVLSDHLEALKVADVDKQAEIESICLVMDVFIRKTEDVFAAYRMTEAMWLRAMAFIRSLKAYSGYCEFCSKHSLEDYFD